MKLAKTISGKDNGEDERVFSGSHKAHPSELTVCSDNICWFSKSKQQETVVAATVERLILFLTQTHDKVGEYFYPLTALQLTPSDKRFRIEFLHCYPYFTNGRDLLKFLSLRFEGKLESSTSLSSSSLTLIQERYVDSGNFYD